MNPANYDSPIRPIRTSPAVGGAAHLVVLIAALIYLAYNSRSLYHLLIDPLPSPRSTVVLEGMDALYRNMLEELDRQKSDTQNSPVAASKRIEGLIKMYEAAMPELHLNGEAMGEVRPALKRASEYLNMASLSSWELRRMTRDDNVRGLEAEARANVIMAITEIRSALVTMHSAPWEFVQYERDQRIKHIALNMFFGLLSCGLLLYLFQDRTFREWAAVDAILAATGSNAPPWATGGQVKARPADMVVNLDETMVVKSGPEPEKAEAEKPSAPEPEAAEAAVVKHDVDAAKSLAEAAARSFHHDLTVINGYSDLLLESIPGEDPMHLDIRAIRRAGERANVLAGQLQSFANSKPDRWEPVEVNRWLEAMRGKIEALLTADVKLVFDFGASSGIVRGDPDQLEQALKSLVLNACNAMSSGGTVTVQTAVHEPNRGEFWTALTVRDTGRGMDAALLRRLFEPGRNNVPNGETGIGLPSVAAIVEQHHGHVEVESQPGKGSSFHLLLPRAAAGRARVTVRN